MGKVFDNAPIRAGINRKIFVKRDVFVYLCLAIIIITLFSLLFIFREDDSQGFKVTINETTVLTHSYGKDFKVESGFEDVIEITKSNDGENFTIKFNFEHGFNTLIVNELEKTVKMQDSDCPSKNCTYMPEISSSGAIYCAPRKLKISPISGDEFTTPSTGVGGAG